MCYQMFFLQLIIFYRQKCLWQSKIRMEVISNREHTRRCIPEWRRSITNKNKAKSFILGESCDIEKFVPYLEIHCTLNDGKMKYLFLVCLFKLILFQSHGNSAPENVFSINKLLLEIMALHWRKKLLKR